MTFDLDQLWDFEDPVGSEQRFRRTAETADGAERVVLLTQVARALGLQERYDEGHAVLDDLVGWDNFGPDEVVFSVQSRIELERGRLCRSAGRIDEAATLFEDAATSAREAGNQALEVDALHMQALMAPPPEAIRLDESALRIARRSREPAAQRWEASLLNNLGCALVDAGRLDEALQRFEEAVPLREARNQQREAQIARWMVAWTLRLQGRTDEALALQRTLKDELMADGVEDPYVDEEIALLEGRTS